MYDKLSSHEREAMLKNDKYPRSAKYDVGWIWKNQLGSHCLWLAEALTNLMDLRPGLRVLDLGCGKVLGSVSLAKEFGCQVWAVDVGVSPTDSLARVEEAGVEDLVFPLHGDARTLPFAEGFFDAVLKPGAQIGLIVPGLLRDIEGEVPEHLRELWVEHFVGYHTPHWWKRHPERTGLVRVDVSDDLGDGEGARIFRLWDWLHRGEEGEAVRDNGRHLTFVRLVARKL